MDKDSTSYLIKRLIYINTVSYD